MDTLTKPESHTSFLLCFLFFFGSIIHQTIMPRCLPSTHELTQNLLNSLLFVFFSGILSQLHLSSSPEAVVTCLDIITCAARSPMRSDLKVPPSASIPSLAPYCTVPLILDHCVGHLPGSVSLASCQISFMSFTFQHRMDQPLVHPVLHLELPATRHLLSSHLLPHPLTQAVAFNHHGHSTILLSDCSPIGPASLPSGLRLAGRLELRKVASECLRVGLGSWRSLCDAQPVDGCLPEDGVLCSSSLHASPVWTKHGMQTLACFHCPHLLRLRPQGTPSSECGK